MENPMVNYKKIIADTNSRMFNVRDEYKENTLEQNQQICKVDRLPFSVGMINVTGCLNIGMALRSACLLGAENFYIFGRKKFDARSTVGAENYINIVQYSYDDPMTADEHILAELRELNKTHSVILCEHGGYMLGENDFGWAYEERPSPLFIFGSESHGIPKLITDQVASDGYPEYEFERISIPQRGVLRSFNVSAAMAIVCWDYIKDMGL
jgi:tRNA G18 (ribose-2'-O)-methylase SpoU